MGFHNSLEPELSAPYSLQKTEVLNVCLLLCLFVATDICQCSVFSPSHCAITLVVFQHQRIKYFKMLSCHSSTNMQHQTVSVTAASWCAGICSCSHCDSSPVSLNMSNTAESSTLISTVDFLSKMSHTYLL